MDTTQLLLVVVASIKPSEATMLIVDVACACVYNR